MTSPHSIDEAVRDCADYACQAEKPVTLVFEYVQSLILSGWDRAEAEEVGHRAVGIVNAWQGRLDVLEEKPPKAVTH